MKKLLPIVPLLFLCFLSIGRLAIGAPTIPQTPAIFVERMNLWRSTAGRFHAIEEIRMEHYEITTHFYSLHDDRTMEWISKTSMDIDSSKPTAIALDFITFKKRGDKVQSYFPILKQRVYRFGRSGESKEFDEFISLELNDKIDLKTIETFSKEIRVIESNKLEILLDENLSKKLFGAPLVIHMAINAIGQLIEFNISTEKFFQSAIYSYDNDLSGSDTLISKMFPEAQKMPLITSKEFPQAQDQAINILKSENKQKK